MHKTIPLRKTLSLLLTLVLVFTALVPAQPAQAATGTVEAIIHYDDTFTYPPGFDARSGTVTLQVGDFPHFGKIGSDNDRYIFTGVDTDLPAVMQANFPGYELKSGTTISGIPYASSPQDITVTPYKTTQVYFNIVPVDQTYHIDYYLQNADGSFPTTPTSSESKTAPTASTVYATVDNTAEGTYKDFAGYTPSPSISEVSGAIPGEGTLSLKVYYTLTTDNQYTVKYQNQKGASILPDKVVTGQAMGAVITETPPEIAGYTAPAAQEITVNNDATQSITFTYSGKADNYTVRFVDEAGNELLTSKTATDTVGETITERATPVTGYTTPEDISLLLSANAEDNVITFMYTADTTTLPYTVEYYKGSEPLGTPVSHTVWTGNPEVDLNTIDTSNIPAGYQLDRYVFANQDPATGTVTIDATNNVIKVYYKIDNEGTLPYTVNYYKDNALFAYEMNDVLIASPTVNDLTDKTPTGYKLEKINFMDGSVSDDTAIPPEGYTISQENNVINVYYIKDDNQRFSYEVHYFKDTEASPFYTEDNLSVPKHDPRVIQVDTATHMPTGYKVARTDPADFPVTLTEDGTIIKVTYTKDDAQTLPYTIEYYKDGALLAYNASNTVPVHTPTVTLDEIEKNQYAGWL